MNQAVVIYLVYIAGSLFFLAGSVMGLIGQLK